MLGSLESEGLLQDRRFAESYVESRRTRGFGPVKIRLELQQRGVDAELIDACCATGDPAWRESVLSVWRKRFACTPPRNYHEWARQARYLQQRGFDTAQIHAALGDYDEQVNGDEP